MNAVSESVTDSTDNKIKRDFVSDQYSLLEKIGEGGFGQVFKAKDAKSGHFVAIKFLVLNQDMDDEKRDRYLERFQRETDLCARLNHPNIVKLLGRGICEHHMAFAVYEFIDGVSLKELLQSEQLEAVEAAELMLEVLDAMAHAHQQGVIHRDLKPANIMLAHSGVRRHAKILDFGIGALTSDAQHLDYRTLTLTQESLGTPSYSSPEQLRGELSTAASDLYVWGLVFIECLTGKAAVSGSSLASVFHKQLANENIQLPTSIIGHPVASLLTRVLQKNVKDRAHDAGLIYSELKRLNMASLIIKTPDSTLNLDSEVGNVVFDETQAIDSNSAGVHTSLTERKQIFVLALTLQAVRDVENIDRDFLETCVRDLRNQCSDLAVGYSGQVTLAFANTLVIYFGYPASSGNDGRLTARTALDMAGLIQRRNDSLSAAHGFTINYRMAINNGQVTCYSDALPEGETVSDAMGSVAFARSNEILCSQDAQKILSNYIEFDDQDARFANDGNQSSTYVAVKGERRAEALGFIRSNKISTTFLGREEELECVIQKLNGVDHFAHIQGEAGIGKSRLAYEVRNQFESDCQLVAQCIPEQSYNGLYPILSLIRGMYFPECTKTDAGKQAIKARLDAFGLTDLSQQLQLFIWLDIDTESEELARTSQVPLDESTLFTMLYSLLQSESVTVSASRGDHLKSTLLVVEDLHWADEKTRSFLQFLLKQERGSSFRLLTTSRESFTASEFSDHQLVLKGLSVKSIQQVVGQCFSGGPVTNDVLAFVNDKTDGVPLYVEELTNMLLADGYVAKVNGVYDFLVRDQLNTIPVGIMDVLSHKLDGLGEAKITAQLASLIGREFSWDMLFDASHKTAEELRADLDRMVACEVLYRQRRVQGDLYIFKHALIRDAAERSVSDAFKQSRHQIFTDYIKKYHDVSVEQTIVSLIYHLDGCQQSEEALEYCQVLVEKSTAKGDFHQAYDVSKKALGFADRLNLGPEKRVAIYSPMTTSAMMMFGWASDEVEKLVEETQELMAQLKPEQKSVEFSAYWAMAIYLEVRGQHLKAVEFIDLAMARARDLADQSALLALKGHSLWAQGQHDAASKAIAEAVALYDQTDPMIHGARYGQDSKVFALSVQGLIASNAGNLSEAERWATKALNQAELVDSPHSIVMAKVYWCCSLFHVRKREDLKQTLTKAKEISEEAGLGNWLGTILVLEGWYENDTAKAQQGLELMLQSGLTEMQGYWNTMIAETEFNNGRVDQALDRIENMVEHSKKTSEFLFVDMLMELKSQITEGHTENALSIEENLEC